LSQKWLFKKIDEASEIQYFNFVLFLGHVECDQNAIQGPNSMLSGEVHVNLRGLR
jgi:hypothetical protein